MASPSGQVRNQLQILLRPSVTLTTSASGMRLNDITWLIYGSFGLLNSSGGARMPEEMYNGPGVLRDSFSGRAWAGRVRRPTSKVTLRA